MSSTKGHVLNVRVALQAADKFFKRAVMDVAWTPDGMTMVACSVDGTIAVFQFDEKDLGGWCCVGQH